MIEDEDFDVERVQKTISSFDNTIHIDEVVSDGKAALSLLTDKPDRFDIVIMDFQIAGGIMGEELIKEIKLINPFIQIIVITKMTLNITDYDFANRLLEAGAFWYCTKYPMDVTEYIYQPTDFILSIRNAFEKRQLEIEQAKSKTKLSKNIENILARKTIIGVSKETTELREQIAMYADSDVNVLISGESGTGKEIIANNIHYHSDRKTESFVPINCGSLPSELIESELFGYESGSFTGANKQKKGLLEIADKGTAFLDEIGELPLDAQVKLLRFLEEGELEKIGRTTRKKVDVRIIAATNKNLAQEVKKGTFRRDLYYRLNIVQIHIPPLRERRDDIKELVLYYLDQYAISMNKQPPQLCDNTLKLLINYDYPGNVRELKSIVQRLFFIHPDKRNTQKLPAALGILPDLPSGYDGNIDEAFDPDNIRSLKTFKEIMYRQYIQFVRNHSKSDAEAARKLDIAPSNFSRLCQDLNLR